MSTQPSFSPNPDPDVLLPVIDIDMENITEGQLRLIEGQLIGAVEERYLKPWLYSRQPIVAQTILNHAFLNGHQYVELKGGQIIPLKKKYRGQVRLVNNVIAPAMRQLLSLLTMNAPAKDATPMAEGFVPEMLSELARKTLGHADRATMAKTKNLELFQWMAMGGNAMKRGAFNVNKGPWEELPVLNDDGHEMFFDEVDEVERPGFERDRITRAERANDPEFDPADRFTPLVEMKRMGELDTIVLSPMQYVGDPSITHLEDHEIFFIQNARSLEWIRKNFPERGGDVKPDGNSIILWDGGSANVLPGIGMPSVTGFTSNTTRTQMPEQAVVTEMYIRPTEKNPLTGDAAPFGVHFVWAGKVALTPPDNPLPYSDPPQEGAKPDLNFDFEIYRWMLNAGLWGKPLLTDGIPVQQSYNRRRSQINESINATVHPKMQMAIGSRIRRKKLSNLPGEVLVYSGAPASYLEPPTVRPYVFSSMETDLQQFNDIMMMHEATRQGRPPPQVRTAAGLRFLQEADTRALGQTLEMFEETEGRFGQMQLDRMNQFYEDERLIKYVGKRNRVEVAMFRRAVFQYDWTVYVRPSSSFPDSRAAKIAEANEMLQFATPMFQREDGKFDKELYAELVGLGNIDSFLADMDESRRTAEHEEMLMDQGEFAPVMRLDDHAMHIRVHTPRIRSNEFRELMKEEPAIARMKLEHLQQHEALLAEQQQVEQQQAAMISMTAKSAAAAQENLLAQTAGAAAASEAREGVKNLEAQENGGVGEVGEAVSQGIAQLLQQLGAQGGQ